MPLTNQMNEKLLLKAVEKYLQSRYVNDKARGVGSREVLRSVKGT